MSEDMSQQGIKYHKYGDNKGTSLPWAAQTVKILSQHLNTMWVWMGKNQLQFNPTKTGLAVDFNILSIWWFDIFNSGLDDTRSELVCSLGIPLDSWALVKGQVVAMARKTFAQIEGHMTLR